jgi:hypothetical protein
MGCPLSVRAGNTHKQYPFRLHKARCYHQLVSGNSKPKISEFLIDLFFCLSLVRLKRTVEFLHVNRATLQVPTQEDCSVLAR